MGGDRAFEAYRRANNEESVCKQLDNTEVTSCELEANLYPSAIEVLTGSTTAKAFFMLFAADFSQNTIEDFGVILDKG